MKVFIQNNIPSSFINSIRKFFFRETRPNTTTEPISLSSDYENLSVKKRQHPNSPSINNNQSRNNNPPLATGSLSSSNANSSSKTSIKISASNNNNNHYKPVAAIPNSKSYFIPITASIMSNPPTVYQSPPSSPPQEAIASIRSNPAYYGSPFYGSHLNHQFQDSNIVVKNTCEFVRTPHGIYTRTSVMPTNQQRINSIPNSPSAAVLSSYSSSSKVQQSGGASIPQSASSVLISNSAGIYTRVEKGSAELGHSAVGNNRAGSLRSMQNKATAAQHSIKQFELLNNKINNSNYVMPSTKQLLQNHSFRIANIQQQQMMQNGSVIPAQPQPLPPNNGNSYYVISQAPPKNNLEINFRNMNMTKGGGGLTANGKLNHLNRGNKDFIEQFDYI